MTNHDWNLLPKVDLSDIDKMVKPEDIPSTWICKNCKSVLFLMDGSIPEDHNYNSKFVSKDCDEQLVKITHQK
jgi:hypothetical protein